MAASEDKLPSVATYRRPLCCIHWKDNSPKLVNHCLTLTEGTKVRSVHINKFPAHDFLNVHLTLQTSRTNNKQVISSFKFSCPCLTLKEELKIFRDKMHGKNPQLGNTGKIKVKTSVKCFITGRF